jgi:transposase
LFHLAAWAKVSIFSEVHIMTTGAKSPRRHSDEFKARVLAQCAEPGASIAAVAQAHGLKVNLVSKWRRGRGAPKFASAAQAANIRIELHRSALAFSITWLLGPAFCTGRRCFLLQPTQPFNSRFVARVLGHQFAAEGLGLIAST